MLKEVFVSMRPRQWYKNIVIFAGILFSQNLLNLSLLKTVVFAFIVFCLLSSGEYIINDVVDVERDRKHPTKSRRPIASGKLKKHIALLFSIFFISLAFVGAKFINSLFLLTCILYFFLILTYSLILKKIVILDVITIALGFVLRAIAGCFAINVMVSPWLIICAFMLALFLALIKRKCELVAIGNEAIAHRTSFGIYSLDFLETLVPVSTSGVIISYALYASQQQKALMLFTLPIVIYGVFRYLYLANSGKIKGDADELFKDLGMVLSLAVWGLMVIVFLYFSI